VNQEYQYQIQLQQVFDSDGVLKKSWHDSVFIGFSKLLDCTLCMRRHRLNAEQITADVYIAALKVAAGVSC